MQPETADRWLDAWVLEATGRGLPKDGTYWRAGWDWIAGSGRRDGPAGSGWCLRPPKPPWGPRPDASRLLRIGPS